MNDGLVTCLSIFHLHSLVLPRKVYNIDNDSNTSLGMVCPYSMDIGHARTDLPL